MLSEHNWVLSVGTFLPLVGVIIMLFLPKADEALTKAVGIITAAATLAVGVFTLIQFDYGRAGEMQFVANHEWISVIKSSYFIGLDGISLPLYFLSMVITLLVMIYSWDHVPSPGNPKAFFILMMNPGRFRWHAVVQHFDMVGVRALGIVGLMSFLIGIVIAQQGAVQLRQFGAEIFTINLIGRLTLRELGILMTAIIVAGRSGSAFAAQIGTMKITEEIDAMRTIGVVPAEALVVPRVIASVIMMPLLGIYASLMSIIGGGILCWIVLDIPPATFVQRLREVTPLTDFWVGMIKAPIFGAIIAMAGCFQGMQVKGNAEQVGLKTTAAVVQAIFLVIVLDAFFAVFFSEIGWG